MAKKKRTVSLDASDEALIEQICLKYSPFARPHQILRLALKYGMRALHDDLERAGLEPSGAVKP
jgi:hypothetical protein